MAAMLTIPTIFTAIDRFSGPLLNMQHSVTNYQRSLKNVSDTAKTVSQNTLLAGLAIGTPLFFAAKDAAAFEKMMAKVNTINGLTGKGMLALNQQVLNITKKIPVTLEDVSEGLYKINSAGILGSQGIDMVTNASKLAIGGMGTVKEASDLMSSVFNVFNKEGLTSAEIYNKLALVVKTGKTHISDMTQGFGQAAITVQLAGVHLNEFLSMVSALTNTGSTAAEAYTQVTGIATALLKPHTGMLRAFKELGVHGSYAAQELIKRYHGVVPAIDAVNGALDKLGIRRAAAWGRIRGFAGQAALGTGGKSHETFNNILGQMQNQPSVGDQMFETMLKTTDAQFQLLKNNLRVFAIEVGTKLLPVLTKLIHKITPVVDGIINWMDRNPGLTETIIKVTAAIAGLLLVVSPIAMAVSLVSDGMRIWSLFAGRAASKTIELGIKAAEARVQVKGFAAAINGVDDAMAATVGSSATAGFLETIAGIVGSIGGLISLAATPIVFGFYEANYGSASQMLEDAANEQKNYIPLDQAQINQWNKHKHFIKPPHDIYHSPFATPGALPAAAPDALRNMPVLLKPTVAPSDIRAANSTTSQVDIYLHDPGKTVRDIKVPAGSPLHVEVGSTMGKR